MQYNSKTMCMQQPGGVASVNLDNAVDLPDEEQAGQEADGAGHDEEEQHHDGGVAEEEEVAEGARDARLVHKVVQGEEEEVEAGGPRGKEAAPPPAVVLRAQVEVAEEDGGLGRHQHQHHKGQHDEPKHVVDLARPAGGGGISWSGSIEGL